MSASIKKGNRPMNELNQYCATFDRYMHNFFVYRWKAARKKFRRIGIASNYSEADRIMRAHIRKRQRRRYPVWRRASVFARCDECGMLRRAHYSGVCFACAVDLASTDSYCPDDPPSFDPMFLM